MNRASLAPYLAFLEMKRKVLGVKYFAEIDITDNCNLRCKHCYHFHGKDVFEKKELPLTIWKKRFIKLYKQGIRFVLLVGGEPALRPDVLMLAHRNWTILFLGGCSTLAIDTLVILQGNQQKYYTIT